MTNDERNPNPQNQVKGGRNPFVIWILVFLWHSSFGFRHYPECPYSDCSGSAAWTGLETA
ncbi:MAG: hypothetical protein DME22_10605 [Verrucomicrobia bacterium]|nr:MAG: hypothetical protein DME22_10605 [Verrucomicrobiota bacterium]PYJ97197.1 MAG: hypothetical protein DME23_16745 [Verrucomicrobiota bacterium]